jgi:hypothetical protein
MFVVLSVIPEIAGVLNSSLLHVSIIPEALDIEQVCRGRWCNGLDLLYSGGTCVSFRLLAVLINVLLSLV